MSNNPVPSAGEVELPAAGQWREGAPPHPWDSEWFLAETTDGHYVVLRTLPEDFTYDFTTVDETYLMRHKIKRWAQLSDSDYVQPEAESVPPAGGSLKCWNCKADFTLSERANCDGCCWKCGNEIDLDDYVTRLQADLARANADKEAYAQNAIDLRKRVDALKAEVELLHKSNYEDSGAAVQSGMECDRLQSKLTKALELLRGVCESDWSGAKTRHIEGFLAHQSAPAAKGGE